MKTKNLKSVIMLTTALAMTASVLFTACKKDEPSSGGGTQPETSSYWSDSYRQNQLNGKVKTVKTYNEGPDEYLPADDGYHYGYLEFDQAGNLLKRGRIYPNQSDIYYGYIYSYDSQNRVIKASDVSGDRVNYEVEYGYDGSHHFYLPTNYLELMNLDITNLRMQKGLTSFKLTRGTSVLLDANCKTVTSNHLTFDATAGGIFATLVGNIDKVDVDFIGNYPVGIKFMEGNTVNGSVDVTLGSDGMPAKLSYSIPALKAPVSIEYTAIAGFLLVTRMTTFDNSPYPGYGVLKYSDKGFPVSAIVYDNNGVKLRESTCTYEGYDSYGNWLKSTGVNKDYENADTTTTISTREFTYW